jgi:NADPH2:quinone reductase
MRSWQVITYGPPEIALKLEELPDPEPDDDEVLVRVHCAGVNFPDLLLCEGSYHHKPVLPFGLGMEASGLVVAVGTKVDSVGIGSRVLMAPMSYGCFSELCIGPEWAVFPLDGNVSWEKGAALFMSYHTAWVGLHRRAHLRTGEWVVVAGASGGVGSAAVDVARSAGANTIGIVSSRKKADFIRERGCDYAIVLGEDSVVGFVREVTSGRGADVVFDPVGGPVFREALRCLGVEGRYLVVGFASGDIPTIGVNYLLMKNVDVVGFRLQPFREDRGYAKAVHSKVMELVNHGGVSPAISEEYGFMDVPAAVARLRKRDVMGKIIVNVA